MTLNSSFRLLLLASVVTSIAFLGAGAADSLPFAGSGVASWSSVITMEKLPSNVRPRARNLHAMAYDGHEGVILFGGTDGFREIQGKADCHCLGDTWRLSGDEWHSIAAMDGPSPRFGHVMAYDRKEDRVVLFGGRVSRIHSSRETWSFRRDVWKRLQSPCEPPAGAWNKLWFDERWQNVCLMVSLWNGGRVTEVWRLVHEEWVCLFRGESPCGMLYDPGVVYSPQVASAVVL